MPPNSSSGETLPEVQGDGDEPEEHKGRGQDTSTRVPGTASLVRPIQGSLFELRLANVSACYSSCTPAERASLSLQVAKSATKSSSSPQQRSPHPILPQTRPMASGCQGVRAGLPFSPTVVICLFPHSNYTKHSLLAAHQLFIKPGSMLSPPDTYLMVWLGQCSGCRLARGNAAPLHGVSRSAPAPAHGDGHQPSPAHPREE